MRTRLAVVVVFGGLTVLAMGVAHAQDDANAAVASVTEHPVSTTERAPARSVNYSFRQLGSGDVAQLRGTEGRLYLPLGIRLD